jgi:hypothetical protein
MSGRAEVRIRPSDVEPRMRREGVVDHEIASLPGAIAER